MKSRAMAVAAARAAAERQAEHIVVLDVRKPITITDYFVIAAASSNRQVRTIAEEIQRALKNLGVRPARREGEAEATWILLDFVDVVVHVFGEKEREFYDLERLWRDAPKIEWEQKDAVSSR